ncbi:unnamed protein product [Rotaria sordida]|uniref:Uncharacterized protein n=1 Tax=Rotaria sordida TaxID=392033 RepID=A0A816CU75_9BILA|nr:unnamed protein product [Rotaria sordida]CAF1326515.1 unnamed protein product [Rotaria sordida]CAF1404182.1 unnamed protein product [Rotaria sordida]CAF1625533.1 unnamed protein product [Rotaria sordida]CAF3796362.1 unnamed protein product [Rotaria sordida]
MISSILSPTVGFNFPRINNNKNIQSVTTLPPETIHLTMHENSYSTEEKIKYIMECINKCMENRQQQPKKGNIIDNGRDTCIQRQCRIYERRR